MRRKRRISIANAFQKVISKGRKPNKIWVDQCGEFYHKLFKRFLKINNIETYSTCNERKSVVAMRFIRTLKNNICKNMTAISKNVYFDVLDNIVNKYNKTVHKTIKMKSIEVTLILMLNTLKILMKKILNLKLVIMSEYQNTKTFLLNDTLKIGPKTFLSLPKLKALFQWT